MTEHTPDPQPAEEQPSADDPFGAPPPRPPGDEGSRNGESHADAPPGWEDYRPGADPGQAPRPQVPDLGALIALLDALRDVVPRELSDQFNALVRELLLTLRALIDWYLERLDAPPREAQVEDIPID